MNISAGQINPAVTIGLLLIKKLKTSEAVVPIIAQLIGAKLAGILLKSFFPTDAGAATFLGTPTLGKGITAGKGLGLEIIATVLLAMAVYGSALGCKAPKGIGGFGIALTIAMLILAIDPFTGAAMNPARHFGTAIISGHLDNIWIYWVGPIAGAIIGFQLFSRIFEPSDSDK